MISKKNQLASSPIGIFDSGIGGLTVANAIRRKLPNEDLIYFGDTAHLPYGEKSADSIRYYALRISKFLLDRNCKMIVIACNSASSAAYDILLDFFEGKILFVNVVDPLVNAVTSKSYEKIGVIATKATIHSGIYRQKIKHANQRQQVFELATPLLAPMIEEGFHHELISQTVLESYLQNPSLEGIDALLLACTHYPLIKDQIENYFKHKVDVYDATDLVANDVYQKLQKENLLSKEQSAEYHFFVSDYTSSFEKTTKLFYQNEVKLELHPI